MSISLFNLSQLPGSLEVQYQALKKEGFEKGKNEASKECAYKVAGLFIKVYIKHDRFFEGEVSGDVNPSGCFAPDPFYSVVIEMNKEDEKAKAVIADCFKKITIPADYAEGVMLREFEDHNITFKVNK